MICTVEDLERWRDRIYEVIHRGAYYVNLLTHITYMLQILNRINK